MPDQSDESNEDGASEIVSPLKHTFEEIQGSADGGPRTIVEKRGIRTSTRPLDRALLENEVQEALSWTPADTHELLFMAANRHLRAKGEMDFFAVVGTADAIAQHNGEEAASPEMLTDHFRLWLEKMKSQNGALSIETAAAGFIQASDRLFMLLSETPEMQAAAHAYADAWHWLHMELAGEHELAAKGSEAERALKAGPEAKRRQGALRSAIIALAYKKFADGEPNEANRTSTKYAGEAILNPVNKALSTHGLEPIALGTIKNQLPAIIKGDKPKEG